MPPDKTEAAPAQPNAAMTPKQKIDGACRQITDSLKKALLSRTVQSTPGHFRKLLMLLFKKMGYTSSSTETTDRALETINTETVAGIMANNLGLDIFYFQARQYPDDVKIELPEIQDFATSLVASGSKMGIFVITSVFSDRAEEYTRNFPQQIVLIDGEKLASLLLEHNVGVKPSQIVELKAVDENFFLP